MRVSIVEKMVILVIGLIVIMFAVNAFYIVDSKNTASFGLNGMTEMRCLGGYRFVVGQQGEIRQVMDEFGKGLKCN